MPCVVSFLRVLAHTGLFVTLAFWMSLLGVLGLWSVTETPGWCAVYFVGLAFHALLLRKPTRTRAGFEAWCIAGLVALLVVVQMEHADWPFHTRKIGGWNSVLDGGEPNWTLWPYVHLALWWPIWWITRALPWPRTSPTT